jgi:hypothetical protein
MLNIHTKEKYREKLHITRFYDEYDGYIAKSKILFRIARSLTFAPICVEELFYILSRDLI